MPKAKIKTLLPTLRERKRYLAFEIISREKISDVKAVTKEIFSSCKRFIGELGLSKAGLIVLEDKYRNNKGMIRVSHKSVENLKASLMLINKVEDKEVIFRTLGVSGIMKKANNRYIAS